MSVSIPKPEDYGVSPISGFLPELIPLERIPSPYYNKWEATIQNLQALTLSRRLRAHIRRLPVLSTQFLRDEAEWRRAYLILAFLTHSYIWGGDTPEERVPPPISIPFKEICAHLELPTVATYAGVCLWNWKPVCPEDALDDLDNLATLHTFTGSMDESWFYLVSVAIEAKGAPVVSLLLDAMAAVQRDDPERVGLALQLAAERIDELGPLLNRMYEQCDAHVFYNKIRPFLAGSKNMAAAGLPNGVIFDTGSDEDEYVQYGGGSNAQSPIIQFFDIALGVEHHPTGERQQQSPAEGASPSPSTRGPPQDPSQNFITDMRKYMLGSHRHFLEDVSAAANIRPFVNQHKDNKQLVIAFDACLAMLRALRDKHIQMVSRYIIVKSRESKSHSPAPATGAGTAAVKRPVNLAHTRPAANGEQAKPTGTGGTALIPFLRQARDETSDGFVNSWAKRLLGDKPMSARGVPLRTGLGTQQDKSAASGGAGRREEVLGLSGRWAMDDTDGGICHW